MNLPRELTEHEQRMLTLLDRFEELMHWDQLTLRIGFTIDSLTWVVNQGIRIVRADFDERDGTYYAMFTKDQYAKYIHLCAKSIGWTISLDGTVTTRDKLTIPTVDKR